MLCVLNLFVLLLDWIVTVVNREIEKQAAREKERERNRDCVRVRSKENHEMKGYSTVFFIFFVTV